MREEVRSTTGLSSLPHVHLAPMSSLGPTGERQQHLAAILAFAGVGQRMRMFRVCDMLTVRWATGDLTDIVASC